MIGCTPFLALKCMTGSSGSNLATSQTVLAKSVLGALAYTCLVRACTPSWTSLRHAENFPSQFYKITGFQAIVSN